MSRLLTLAFAAALSGAFGTLIPFDRFIDTIPQVTTLLSIMIAAVLVRLNRGMPTIDWKNVEPANRVGLTTAIYSLTKQYAYMTAVLSVSLILTYSISLIGKDYILSLGGTKKLVLACICGFLFGISIARMAYLVWRDTDVVRLQKAVVDAAAEKEQRDAAASQVDARLQVVKSAGLRKVGEPTTTPWSN